jgi:hypothetical protein
MANLMLSVMGAFAEFERSRIRDRQGKASLFALYPRHASSRVRTG